MTDLVGTDGAQVAAEARVQKFRDALGPFVVAAETTRMAMIFTDALSADNSLVFANDSFLALTGFARDRIMGRPIDVLLGDVTDRGTWLSIKAALDGGTEGTWEMPCRRVDGSEFLAAVYLSPVRDRHGVVCQNFLSFVELGGHIDRLLAQRDELHALYEQAPGFIATSEGPDHRFTFANAAYKRLIARGDPVGLTVAETLPEIVAQGFVALLDQVFATGKPYVGTSVPILLRSDAGPDLHYISFVYEPVRDAGGRITGLFCEGHDVTAERLAADQLAALQGELIHLSRVNAMGTMATTLAHELNQPLAAIASYAAGALRLVLAGESESLDVPQALRAIDEASHRAGDIIRNLRDFTQRGETKRSNFDLKVAIGECIRLVRGAGCLDAELNDLTADGLMMAGDRIQIQQVLINLLRNACAAVPLSGSPKVTVSAVLTQDRIVVSVADTGPGVSAAAAENIFTWSDASKEGGMGLGLAISRTIVEAHGGAIWLENSGKSGSVFCFSVPAALLLEDNSQTGLTVGF